MQSLLCFVVNKKDFLDLVLNGNKSLQKFTKKSLLQQAAQNKGGGGEKKKMGEILGK